MYLQTQFILTKEFRLDFPSLFIFFGTHFLYAIHRIVGLRKVKPFQTAGRYKVIARFQHHILLYAVLSSLVCLYLIFQLEWLLWKALIIPAILSLGYVLPFLGQQKRLRDLHYIKIFLVAGVWSWLTVMIPAVAYGLEKHFPVWIVCLEKAFFIFAITLPFDIRDLQIDQFTKVKTLPALIGIQTTKYSAIFLLILSSLLVYLNFSLDVLSFGMFLGLISSYSITIVLVWFSDRIIHDYYFTGLLDGSMLIQFILFYLFHQLF